MAEHTPTPWNFDELTPNARGEQDGCGYIRCETDNLEISHHGDRGRSRDENVANATFIVKACNSHDALVKALRHIADMPIAPSECCDASMRHVARAALQEAAR